MSLRFHPVVVATVALTLSGCGVSGAPSCSDSEVTGLVLQIASENLGTNLMGETMGKQLMNNEGNLFNVAAQYPSLGYADWKNDPPIENEDMQKLVAIVDAQLASITLQAIRTTDTNDEIQKCSCGGQLDIPKSKSISIEYTGQYTEDGQIWVEVFGIQ